MLRDRNYVGPHPVLLLVIALALLASACSGSDPALAAAGQSLLVDAAIGEGPGLSDVQIAEIVSTAAQTDPATSVTKVRRLLISVELRSGGADAEVVPLFVEGRTVLASGAGDTVALPLDAQVLFLGADDRGSLGSGTLLLPQVTITDDGMATAGQTAADVTIQSTPFAPLCPADQGDAPTRTEGYLSGATFDDLISQITADAENPLLTSASVALVAPDAQAKDALASALAAAGYRTIETTRCG